MADSEDKFVPEKGFYQPSSDQTWEAYQALITVVDSQTKVVLPREVLCGVADEVLWVLKTKNIPSPADKKAEIEKILNPIPYFIYNQLVSTASLITDYPGSGGVAAEKDFYQPKSEETWVPYKLLLDLINDQFGFEQPDAVQCTLAHEVLVTLKDESIDNWKKRNMIANTLEPISNQALDHLLSIGERITDFNEVAALEYMNDPTPALVQYDFDFVTDFQYEVDFADEAFLDPEVDDPDSDINDNEGEVDDPNSDSDVNEVNDNEAQSSSSGDELGFENVRVGDKQDTEHVSEVADNDAQSSSSDDELRNLGFEKVRVGDKQDTEDWVVVD